MTNIETTIRQRRELRALVLTGEARARRVRAGVTLTEAGEECGVMPSTIWRWECSQRFPRGADVGRYLDLLRKLGG